MRKVQNLIKKVLLICATFVWLSACQEPYDELYMLDNEIIPVVQGSITNEPGPYTVSLRWASSFKKSIISPIRNAKITISDNEGNSELLFEDSIGNYLTNANGIKGIVGRKYKLTIKLVDGKILESPAIKLEPAIIIDTIYAEIGEKTEVKKTMFNDFITTTYSGIYIYANLKPEPGETKYLRFENNYIWQIWRSTGGAPSYYRFIRTLTDIPDVKATLLVNNIQVVVRQPLGFLEYFPNLPDQRVHAGWIMCPKVSTIPISTYLYYENIARQVKAGAKIFDPIPSQITGNMKCVTDSTYIVLGLFDVCSKSVKYTAFMWSKGSTLPVRSKNIDDPGPMTDLYDAPFRPSYWVSF